MSSRLNSPSMKPSSSSSINNTGNNNSNSNRPISASRSHLSTAGNNIITVEANNNNNNNTSLTTIPPSTAPSSMNNNDNSASAPRLRLLSAIFPRLPKSAIKTIANEQINQLEQPPLSTPIRRTSAGTIIPSSQPLIHSNPFNTSINNNSYLSSDDTIIAKQWTELVYKANNIPDKAAIQSTVYSQKQYIDGNNNTMIVPITPNNNNNRNNKYSPRDNNSRTITPQQSIINHHQSQSGIAPSSLVVDNNGLKPHPTSIVLQALKSDAIASILPININSAATTIQSAVPINTSGLRIDDPIPEAELIRESNINNRLPLLNEYYWDDTGSIRRFKNNSVQNGQYNQYGISINQSMQIHSNKQQRSLRKNKQSRSRSQLDSSINNNNSILDESDGGEGAIEYESTVSPRSQTKYNRGGRSNKLLSTEDEDIGKSNNNSNQTSPNHRNNHNKRITNDENLGQSNNDTALTLHQQQQQHNSLESKPIDPLDQYRPLSSDIIYRRPHKINIITESQLSNNNNSRLFNNKPKSNMNNNTNSSTVINDSLIGTVTVYHQYGDSDINNNNTNNDELLNYIQQQSNSTIISPSGIIINNYLSTTVLPINDFTVNSSFTLSLFSNNNNNFYNLIINTNELIELFTQLISITDQLELYYNNSISLNSIYLYESALNLISEQTSQLYIHILHKLQQAKLYSKIINIIQLNNNNNNNSNNNNTIEQPELIRLAQGRALFGKLLTSGLILVNNKLIFNVSTAVDNWIIDLESELNPIVNMNIINQWRTVEFNEQILSQSFNINTNFNKNINNNNNKDNDNDDDDDNDSTDLSNNNTGNGSNQYIPLFSPIIVSNNNYNSIEHQQYLEQHLESFPIYN